MTITIRAEKPRGGSRESTGEGNTDDRVFICESSTVDAYSIEFESVIGLPRYGDTHPSDPMLRCVSLAPRQMTAPRMWEVTVSYAKQSAEEAKKGQESQEATSPTQLRPEVRWSAVQYQEIVHGAMRLVDAQSNSQGVTERGVKFEGVTTSAGEPYDPPFEIDASRPVCSVHRAERVYDARVILEYIHTINSDPFVLDGVRIPSYSARIFDIRIDTVQYDDDGFPFRWVDYEIQLKWSGWVLRPLNYGSFYLEGGHIKPFTDAHGNRILGFLDANGAKLEPQTGEKTYGEFYVYQQTDFRKLNLPTVSR